MPDFNYDTGADNPFGRDDLEAKPNAALRAHLASHFSIISFPRTGRSRELTENLINKLVGDLVAGKKG